MLYRHLPENRRSDKINAPTVGNGIEPHRTHHVPRRHLTGIVVAADPFGRSIVQRVDHVADPFLPFPRLSGIIVHVKGVMPRLVALRILSDQAGNIGRWVVAVYLGADRKQRIEFGDERIAAAEQIHQPLAVVRHEKSPLPRSAFAEIVVRPVVVRMERIERRPPTAVGIPAAHKVQILIEKILIPAGPADVIVVVVPVPEHPRHLSDAPVVVAIFEGLRNGSHLQIARHVLVLLVITRPAERFQKITERIAVGRRFHRLVKRFRIVTANPFAISVGNQRHRVITDHAHVLDAGQRPDRQLTAVFIRSRITSGLRIAINGFCARNVSQRPSTPAK